MFRGRHMQSVLSECSAWLQDARSTVVALLFRPSTPKSPWPHEADADMDTDELDGSFAYWFQYGANEAKLHPNQACDRTQFIPRDQKPVVDSDDQDLN